MNKFVSINNLFKIVKGNATHTTLRKASRSKQALPLIVSSKNNNGVHMFTKPKSSDIIFYNALTINNSGSVGIVFYHPYHFIASEHVTVLEPRYFKLTLTLAMYYKSAIEKQKPKWSFGYAISNQRLKNMRICKPVTDRQTDKYIRTCYNNLKQLIEESCQ